MPIKFPIGYQDCGENTTRRMNDKSWKKTNVLTGIEARCSGKGGYLINKLSYLFQYAMVESIVKKGSGFRNSFL
jgi:hypothetical protein